QAVKALVDAGRIEEAKSVITFLLDNADLTTPHRQSLMQQVSQPTEGWRIQLEQLIQDCQPFHLIYGKPNGESIEFTVRCAELIPYEKRLYLQIWCEEITDNKDLAALQHNRTLRLDRIKGLVPIGGQWHGQFDHMLVEVHLLKGLVYAYEARPEDVEDRIIDQIRRVVRRIHNTFWFFREVRRYGADCVVVGPADVRDRFIRDLQQTLQNYSN
ncbi:MAG: WYL domain-containing protein, partial [Cyanobacteria bacterium J06559_3]